jgi:hypothetical protein
MPFGVDESALISIASVHQFTKTHAQGGSDRDPDCNVVQRYAERDPNTDPDGDAHSHMVRH